MSLILILIPFSRLRAFFHGYSSKDSLDRCIDNVCMFPTEDSLYLLTDAAMALKVDPETLDTTDEVRNDWKFPQVNFQIFFLKIVQNFTKDVCFVFQKVIFVFQISQSPPQKYSKKLSWAWNLNKLFTDMGRNFKFQTLDYFFDIDFLGDLKSKSHFLKKRHL